MKKIIKNPIFTFILGAIIFGSVGVIAANYAANGVNYTPKDTTWKKQDGSDITTVKDALDDLYKNKNILTGKLTEVNDNDNGTVTLQNNTHKTIYAVLFSFTGENSGAATIISTRTTISNISGATYEEVFYSYGSNKYGIRVYKLTNCESTISVSSGTSLDGYGQIILFY